MLQYVHLAELANFKYRTFYLALFKIFNEIFTLQLLKKIQTFIVIEYIFSQIKKMFQ